MLGGSLAPVLTRLDAGIPWTPVVFQVPSAARAIWPKLIPFDISGRVCPEQIANGAQVGGDLAGQHLDESRSKHAERRPRVERLLRHRQPALVQGAAQGDGVEVIEGQEVEALPDEDRVGREVPAAPQRGTLWQLAQLLASIADSRLKLRGNTSGELGSESGLPVPFESGRPPPSCEVKTASNSSWPWRSSFEQADGVLVAVGQVFRDAHLAPEGGRRHRAFRDQRRRRRHGRLLDRRRPDLQFAVRITGGEGDNNPPDPTAPPTLRTLCHGPPRSFTVRPTCAKGTAPP